MYQKKKKKGLKTLKNEPKQEDSEDESKKKNEWHKVRYSDLWVLALK